MLKIHPLYWLLAALTGFFKAVLLYKINLNGKTQDLNPGIISSTLSFPLALFILLLFILLLLRLFNIKPSKKGQHTVFFVLFTLVLLAQVGSSFTDLNIQKDVLVSSCVEKLESEIEENPNLRNYDIKLYCECIADKSKNLKMTDTAWMKKEGSIKSIEFYGDCLAFAKIPTIKAESIADIGPDTLPVIDLGGHISVKVSVNNKEVYLLFDSGASDILLSDDFVADFDETEISYTGEYETYTMVDGREIKARKALISTFRIGKYRFTNLEVAVTGALQHQLLGKSLLDQFNSWTIVSGKTLILTP